MTTSACGTTCDGTCGWCRLTAERDVLKAELFHLKTDMMRTQERNDRVEGKADLMMEENLKLEAEVGRLEGACDKCDLSVMRDKVVRLREALEATRPYIEFAIASATESDLAEFDVRILQKIDAALAQSGGKEATDNG